MAFYRQPTTRKYIIAKDEIAAHILENYNTDVTAEQIETWLEFDLYEWLEAWGFVWDGQEWANLGGDDDN